ncbi:MAG: hypothetical protein GXP15_00750 [Gammaproteobacteria bacterium]|nr:hypothetical protein [Gammaproteobacteria bacterium]
MDELTKRLKQDAAGIQADVSPELAMRVAASIRASERETGDEEVRALRRSFWWASSLTGLAAAAIVLALLNRNAVKEPLEVSEQPLASVVPESVWPLSRDFTLKVENADFAEPLEDELEKLKGDLEKARNNVRRDLRYTF